MSRETTRHPAVIAGLFVTGLLGLFLGAGSIVSAAPPPLELLPGLRTAPELPVRSIVLRRAFPDHPLGAPPGRDQPLPIDGAAGCDKDVDLTTTIAGVVAVAAQDNGICTNTDIDTYVDVSGSTYVVQAGGKQAAWTHTDVSNPAAPVVRLQFCWDFGGVCNRDTNSLDVKAFHQGTRDYIAMGLDRVGSGGFCGVVIVDVTEPTVPAIESQFIGTNWCDTHNVFVEKDPTTGEGIYIYATADATNDLRVLDVGGAYGGSVMAPAEVGRYTAPTAGRRNFVHDVTVIDHGGAPGRRVYLAYWNSGLVILKAEDGISGLDLTEIVGPNQIDPPNFKTHHAFASQDGSLVFIQDEILKAEGDQPIQMWSVADPAAPSYVDGLALGTDVAVNPAHNLEIRDDIHPDRLYVGWYKLGLLAWDFTATGFVRYDPSPPTAVLYHQAQTEAEDGRYSGTWGVRLEVIDRQVYVFQSDRRYGLIVERVAVEASFESIASEDGWVRESRENSGLGGRVNTGGTGSKALRAGDDRKDQQYKFVVSFDTSSIPVGATIQSATLQLTRGGTQGTNPFTTHSPLLVDIKKGNFGSGAVLEKSDFQDTVGAAQVATISNQGSRGTVYTVDLAGGLAYINKAGRTQLRIYFARDDNDDRDSDYAGFYSSDNSDRARHPKLIVTYQE